MLQSILSLALKIFIFFYLKKINIDPKIRLN